MLGRGKRVASLQPAGKRQAAIGPGSSPPSGAGGVTDSTVITRLRPSRVSQVIDCFGLSPSSAVPTGDKSPAAAQPKARLAGNSE